jgi:hypothetical protein
MKILIQILYLTMSSIALLGNPLPDRSIKPVTFTINTPDGLPVEAALLEASLPGLGNTKGQTGPEGKVTLKVAKGLSLYLGVYKEGYYSSEGELWTGGIHKGPRGNLIPREIPDKFTITLKPVLDQVQMKATRFFGIVPVVDRPLGFDLERSDWLAPHGKGVITDILFTFSSPDPEDDKNSATMELSFPNNGDGIQSFQAARSYSLEFGSNLPPPNKAPIDGYKSTLLFTKEVPSRGAPNYLIRSRTVLDASGEIRQACYGWIEGEIEFDSRGAGGPQLSFSAYFNPDPNPNARSLEPLPETPGRR